MTLYILYAVKDSDDAVDAAFEARFCRKPKEKRRTGGGTLAGPVTEEERKHGNNHSVETQAGRVEGSATGTRSVAHST